jgi:hypothetical protein
MARDMQKSLDRLSKPMLTRSDKHEAISFGFARLVRGSFFLSLLLTNARGKKKNLAEVIGTRGTTFAKRNH